MNSPYISIRVTPRTMEELVKIVIKEDVPWRNTVGKFVKWLVMDRVNRIGGMALEYGQKPGRKPKPVPERIGPMRKKR